MEALYPYLDRELSDDDIVQVQVHLNSCSECEHLFRFEESLRRIVQVRCQEVRAPDGLRERIVERLTVEAQRRQKSPRRPTRAD